MYTVTTNPIYTPAVDPYPAKFTQNAEAATQFELMNRVNNQTSNRGLNGTLVKFYIEKLQ